MTDQQPPEEDQQAEGRRRGDPRYIGVGLAIGVAIGVGMGNIAVGIALGLVFGVVLSRKNRDD
ncbi:hypothetical protein ACFO5Q_03810 [Kordiimonas lipolytica]|uniref:Septum formation initiator n=1 Tax=Kordiimonas lipolytica TaxID=1662421 RepID=A0ABV8U7T2_9PROT|nr:hypothetical protein [Kordiimonas lipolytica]